MEESRNREALRMTTAYGVMPTVFSEMLDKLLKERIKEVSKVAKKL